MQSFVSSIVGGSVNGECPTAGSQQALIGLFTGLILIEEERGSQMFGTWCVFAHSSCASI